MSGDHPKWLFDESFPVGVDYTDTDTAAGYDHQHERFRDFEQEARKIAAALGLSGDSAVLDMGCGFEFMPHMRAYICSKQQGENDV